MKYIPSIAFEEMSGSAKGVTAANVRGRKYIRNRGYGCFSYAATVSWRRLRYNRPVRFYRNTGTNATQRGRDMFDFFSNMETIRI